MIERNISEKKRIFIVDDHPIIRQGLTQLINQEPDLVVCREAENVRTTLELISTVKPDLVITDISLKGTNGIELIKILREQYPSLPSLVFSMHAESLYAERALRAGAKGYIMKGDNPAKLIEAIRFILKNKSPYISNSVLINIINKIGEKNFSKKSSTLDFLTNRELEIFLLLGQGNGTFQIAEQLSISKKTVESHRANIKKKLKINRSGELVYYAVHWTLRDK